MTLPDFTRETVLQSQGFACIAGVDEVGRGPLAGPVTAAAVILDPFRIPAGLNDSKKLTASRREALAAEIHATARVFIAHATVAEIDEMNILRASHAAMIRALAGLNPDHALIDGNLLPRGLTCPATAVIKGDALSLSIAAASIVAKCCRDAIMVDLAQQHPGYGWETNAGYPTTVHLKALLNLGVTPHHRRSFAPVHKMLYQDKSLTRCFNKEFDGKSGMTHPAPNETARQMPGAEATYERENGCGGGGPSAESDTRWRLH